MPVPATTRWSVAGVLISGSGDTWMEDGDTMVVGDGCDIVLIAGANDEIEVAANNLGVDLILSHADETYNLITALYKAAGFDDWEINYEHAGQISLHMPSGDGGFEGRGVDYYDPDMFGNHSGYFDSAEGSDGLFRLYGTGYVCGAIRRCDIC